MLTELLVLILLTLMFVTSLLRGISMGIPTLLLVYAILVLVIREYRNRKRLDFINQLKSHRKELRRGGTVSVDNLLLRYDSELTSHPAALGFLLKEIVIFSPFRLRDSSQSQNDSLTYSLLTLVAGWWSLFGIFSTLPLVLFNVKGGQISTVAQLIDAPLLARRDEEEQAKVDNPTIN